MKQCYGLAGVGLLTAGLSLSAVAANVTVKDSILMTEFVDFESKREPIALSPNGQRYFVTTRKGNIVENTNDYSLLIFNTADALQPSHERKTLSLSSSSNRPAIERAKWVDDGTVAFLGESQGELHQLYMADIATGHIRQVSRIPTNVIEFELTADGRTAYLLTEVAGQPMVNDKVMHHGIVVTSQWLADLVSLQQRYSARERHQIYKVDLEAGSTVLVDTINSGGTRIMWPSPNGRYVLVSALVRGEFPASWERYQTPEMKRARGNGRIRNEIVLVAELDLIDATSMTRRSLLLPVHYNPNVTWSSDGKSIFVAGVYLPLDVADAQELYDRERRTFIAEVRISDGAITPIAAGECSSLRWDESAERLICRGKSRDSEGPSDTDNRVWEKVGAGWRELGAPESRFNPVAAPDIEIEEDMNTPPRLIAIDPSSHRKSVILDPNPQFSQLRLGHVESLSFHAGNGRRFHGGIYYPPDYVSGRRYPLVIQTHGWNPERFWIDGYSTTAFAAQALAGSGFIVAQIQEIPWDRLYTPREIATAVSAYAGLVKLIDARGLIDRQRIGIIGFSRTGLYVKQALSHPDCEIAAASLADVSDDGYFQYLSLINAPGFAADSEGHIGAAPFSSGLQSWIRHSSGFSLDKVSAPVLLEANDPASIFFEWEWYGGLMRLQKPVEFIYIPEGEHELSKPWDRLVSQQGNVDWFRYWLQSYEDPDPSKAEQYSRWRELRKLRDAQARTRH